MPDPRFFLLEKSTAFSRHWQLVGRTDQLHGTGDYFAGSFLGNPYVATRDEGGQVRAYHNVCRHHGTRVASGEGSLKRFVCPYHGWTYALDGRRVPRLLAAGRRSLELAVNRSSSWCVGQCRSSEAAGAVPGRDLCRRGSAQVVLRPTS